MPLPHTKFALSAAFMVSGMAALSPAQIISRIEFQNTPTQNDAIPASVLRETIVETAEYLAEKKLYCGNNNIPTDFHKQSIISSGIIFPSAPQKPGQIVHCAVIDIGFNPQHPALHGKIENVYGPPMPLSQRPVYWSHGTAVASTLVLYGPDNIKLDLIGVGTRNTDKEDVFYTRADEGIAIAAKSNCDFINISLSLNALNDEPVIQSLRKAVQNGKIIVISAGNDAMGNIDGFDEKSMARINNTGDGELIFAGMLGGNSSKIFKKQIFYYSGQAVMMARADGGMKTEINSSSINAPFLIAELASLKNRYPDKTGKQLVEILRQEALTIEFTQDIGNGLLPPPSILRLALRPASWNLLNASQRQWVGLCAGIMARDAVLMTDPLNLDQQGKLRDLTTRLAGLMTSPIDAENITADPIALRIQQARQHQASR